MKKLFYIFFLLLSVFAIGQNFPAAPNPPKLVTDLTGTLSAGEVASLEAKLVAFDNQTSNQVAIVIIASTGGNQITDYATELGRKWGIGNKQNNGVLLLIAKDDRKLAIVPGNGLEGALPDAVCLAIIDNEITPSFKNGGDYYGGIDKGTEAIMKATQGAYTAPEGYDKRGRKGSGGAGSTLMFIIILVVVIFILSRGGGGRGGGMMSRRGYRGGIGGFPIIFPRGGSGGGWSGGGGSSGGGGFGGFGGGSFGGGGASGSW